MPFYLLTDLTKEAMGILHYTNVQNEHFLTIESHAYFKCLKIFKIITFELSDYSCIKDDSKTFLVNEKEGDLLLVLAEEGI